MEIESLYRQKLDGLSLPYELMTIETSFCDTNIVITGTEENPPLVLIHGNFGCAPSAIEAMVELVAHFRIYAVDIPGQPNLSAKCEFNMKDNSYGEWMYEILSRLGVYNATLVGISRGGFIALKTLIFDEKRIARTFLITPAGIVNGNPLQLFLRVILPLQRYRTTENSKYLSCFLEEIYSEQNEFSKAFLSNALLHFNVDLSRAPLIRKKEARRIKTPVYIFAAEKDVLFPHKRMIRRVKRLFPGLKDTVVLSGSKHVLSLKSYSKIAAYIIKTSIFNTFKTK